MSSSDNHIPEPEGDDLTAAEYVLGVMPQEERWQAARRIDADPAFARLVDQWEVRLAPMASAYEEAEPDAGLKQAIDRRLFGANETVVAGGRFWNSLIFWRGLAGAALAALLLVLAVPALLPTTQTAGERLVASLAHDDTDVRYFVFYDQRAADIGLSHISGARAEDRDFELWMIRGDNAPVSLGVIPVGSNVHLPTTEQVRRAIEIGAVFAISMEPQGGSPTGQPTGPVVAAGELTSI